MLRPRLLDLLSRRWYSMGDWRAEEGRKQQQQCSLSSCFFVRKVEHDVEPFIESYISCGLIPPNYHPANQISLVKTFVLSITSEWADQICHCMFSITAPCCSRLVKVSKC